MKTERKIGEVLLRRDEQFRLSRLKTVSRGLSNLPSSRSPSLICLLSYSPRVWQRVTKESASSGSLLWCRCHRRRPTERGSKAPMGTLVPSPQPMAVYCEDTRGLRRICWLVAGRRWIRERTGTGEGWADVEFEAGASNRREKGGTKRPVFSIDFEHEAI